MDHVTVNTDMSLHGVLVVLNYCHRTELLVLQMMSNDVWLFHVSVRNMLY